MIKKSIYHIVKTLKEDQNNLVNNFIQELFTIFGGTLPDEIKINILKVYLTTKVLLRDISLNDNNKRLLNCGFYMVKNILKDNSKSGYNENYLNELLLILFKVGVIYLRDNMYAITLNEQIHIEQKKTLKSENIIIKVENDLLNDTSILLRKKIGIDDYKERLGVLRRGEQNQEAINQIEVEVVNKVIKYIYEYPYQMLKAGGGYKIGNILYEKEMFCLGYCILGYSYLEELGIKNEGINELRHVSLLINIGNKEYYFDPFKYNVIKEINWGDKIGEYRGFKVDEVNHVGIKGETLSTLLSYVLTYKGIELDEENRPLEAIECYKKAIEIDGLNSFIFNNLGISYEAIGNFENAMKLYEESIILYPNFSLAYNDIGKILLKQKKYIKAIRNFKKAIKTKDLYSSEYYNSSIYSNIGLSYLKIGKYKKAMYYFDLAIINAPDYSKSYKHMGMLLKKIGNDKRGAIYYEIYKKLENNKYIIKDIEINKLIDLREFTKLIEILKINSVN